MVTLITSDGKQKLRCCHPASAYPEHSELPSKSQGRLLRSHPEDTPCRQTHLTRVMECVSMVEVLLVCASDRDI